MAKIVILRGLPASGKTKWAREWIKEDPEHRVRFNRDDIRNMLGEHNFLLENIITDMYYEFLHSATADGYDIVIDNMNLDDKYIADIEEFVNDTNKWLEQSPLNLRYEIEIKDFFNVPLQICIDRDSKREHPIGEMTIRRIYNKHKNHITPWKYLN